MDFTDANSAKDFFIARIATQAEFEGAPLKEVERKMLKWTEVHPIPDIPREQLSELAEKFSSEYNDKEWEEKIGGLIKRAYENDLKNDPNCKQSYKAAYNAIKKEDHYILIMIDAAIGSSLKGWFGLS